MKGAKKTWKYEKMEHEGKEAAVITKYGGCEEEVIVPESIDGLKVAAIGHRAFYKCETAKSIVLPDGLTFIADEAFLKCRNVVSIYIPDSVQSISSGKRGYAGTSYSNVFCGCESLKEIKIEEISIYTYSKTSCSPQACPLYTCRQQKNQACKTLNYFLT